jgi:aminopeptidase N
MDEGWAAFLPGDIIEEYKPGSDYFSGQVQGYAHMAGQEVELPLMVPTFQHNDWSSSRTAAYTRPAVAYQMLRETLGDDLFKKALHEYMNQWKGKHPIPYDFFYTFEEVTGQDLYWFFNPWFFQSGYPDLGIEELTSTNELIIEKKGQFPIPVDITWWTDEDKIENKYLSPEIWKDGQAKIGVQLPTDINIVKIELGNAHIPDVDEGDNVLIID